jgi:hypothetical protein
MTLRKLFLFAAPVAAFFVGMFLLTTLASAQNSVWQNPTQPFSSGTNAMAPIHEGLDDQTKAGPGGSASIFNFPGANRASFQTDYLWSKFGQVVEGKVVADEFCFRDSSLTGALFAPQLTSPLNDCITSWPTITPPPPGATLPPGIVNQTLRHNGTGWEASNYITSTDVNNGARVTIPFHLAASTTSSTQFNAQTIIGDVNNLENYVSGINKPKLTVGGGVGIRTPAVNGIALDVKGTFRLQNGSQASGRVLTSTPDGTGIWAALPAQSSPIPTCAANQVLYRQGTAWVCKNTQSLYKLAGGCQPGISNASAAPYGGITAGSSCYTLQKCKDANGAPRYATCGSSTLPSGCLSTNNGGSNTNPAAPETCSLTAYPLKVIVE